MADILRIVDKFMITGRGPIYIVKKRKNITIQYGDVFYDLKGNKFIVKAIEMVHGRIIDFDNIEKYPVGIMVDMVDGVEVYGNILVTDITDINFLFCSHPLYLNEVDVDYEAEYREARKNFKCGLFNYEDLENGKISLCNDKISGLTIYRGWMMKPKLYREFYALLEENGIVLINTPEEYEKYHMLPGWYDDFCDCTAESIWETNGSVRDIMEKCRTFEGEYIVKDYVKSRKHEWYDACYISNIKNKDSCEQIISNFVDRQGDSLTGGIVLRRYEKLQKIGFHDKSGMPLSEEYRVFVFAGEIHVVDNYWKNCKDVKLSQEELMWIKDIAARIRSNFVTIDLARREDGTLIVMEFGDGQVSGLQEIPAKDFYDAFVR